MVELVVIVVVAPVVVVTIVVFILKGTYYAHFCFLACPSLMSTWNVSNMLWSKKHTRDWQLGVLRNCQRGGGGGGFAIVDGGGVRTIATPTPPRFYSPWSMTCSGTCWTIPSCCEIRGKKPPTHRIAFNSLYLFSLGLLSMKRMERHCIITRAENPSAACYGGL